MLMNGCRQTYAGSIFIVRLLENIIITLLCSISHCAAIKNKLNMIADQQQHM